VDDDRSSDPVGQLLRDFVHDVSEHVVVPAFTPGRPGARTLPRVGPRWRRLAVLCTSVAVAGVIVLAVVYGPRSAPTGPHPGPATQPTLGSSPPNPAASGPCSSAQLAATVAFTQSGTELGAIRLTNTATRACSLAGRPNVVVRDGAGSRLGLSQSIFHRAPDWPPPPNPIVLAPGGALPQAIVQLDWTWCGPSPGRIRFEIRFPGWPSPLTVPDASIFPSGFTPAPCAAPGERSLFAVDVVRGFGSDGIIGPGSVHPTGSLVLGADGVGTVAVGTPEANAVTTMDQSLGRSTATAAGVCPGRTEVEWGDLSLEFSAGVLAGYRFDVGGFPALGTHRPPSAPPQPPLTTGAGATLGMPLAEVEPLYPRRAFSEEQGGAIVEPGTTSGDRLFLGFFESASSTPLTEIKGGAPCGDV
jgi:hypothetical protein